MGGIQQEDEQNNPNTYEDIEKEIVEILKKTVGTKTISINNKPRESKHTKDKRANRNKLKKEYELAIRNKKPNIKSSLKSYINSQIGLREQIEKDNKERINKIVNRLIREGGVKSQTFWKLRKQIIKTNSDDSYDTITEEGRKLEDPTETKEHIARFYENLYQAREGKPQFEKKTKEIKERVKQLERESQNSTPAEPVTMDELNITIKQLKNNKATGPDNIPNEIFTKATNNTKTVYLKIINEIMKTRKVPHQWLNGEKTRI